MTLAPEKYPLKVITILTHFNTFLFHIKNNIIIYFSDWEERDTLLKSCFCKEGHVRIPQSRGCYDPIRKVVTVKDACFTNYHCNDLPNTACVMDRDIPKYNSSCQCIKGNKPFDPNPRTGLIEGCAPLTDADKATILGIN